MAAGLGLLGGAAARRRPGSAECGEHRFGHAPSPSACALRAAVSLRGRLCPDSGKSGGGVLEDGARRSEGKSVPSLTISAGVR